MGCHDDHRTFRRRAFLRDTLARSLAGPMLPAALNATSRNGLHAAEPDDSSGATGGAAPGVEPDRDDAASPRGAGPKGKIRIGQIGTAHGHATKLSVYRQSADYDVVGVVEPNAALRAKAENEPAFRGLSWLTEEQLLQTPGLSAVLVETAVSESLAVAERMVAAGLHVHLDKPAGASLPHFKRLLTAADQRGLLIQLGYMYRYQPAIAWLHQARQDGWIGDIFEIHAVMGKVVPPPDRAELAQFRGGMMFELGCHLIDLVVGLLGEPAQVTSLLKAMRPEVDALHDSTLAVLEYPQATATIRCSGVDVEGFARRQFTVCGTEGTLHLQPLDQPRGRLALRTARGEYTAGWQDIAFPPFTRYVADAADMARIIRGEKPSQFNSAHDLAVQRTVLRASRMPLD
jgi:predicted dehydrogenase